MTALLEGTIQLPSMVSLVDWLKLVKASSSVKGLQIVGSPPDWASGVSSDRERSSFNWAPQPQQTQPQAQTRPDLDYAEPSLATYEFLQTQSAQDAEFARNATLPPLESVLELTDAVRPPLRGEEPQIASTSSAGVCACMWAYSLFLGTIDPHPQQVSIHACWRAVLFLAQYMYILSKCAYMHVGVQSFP